MGVATDAILCYGVELTEDEIERLQASDDSWEFKDYEYAEIVSHCSQSETMYILAAKGTVTTASRGEAKTVDPHQMMGNLDKIGNFEAAVTELGLDPNKTPKWLLCAWWDE